MTDLAWIDQLRDNLLRTEQQLRRALRQAKPDRRKGREGQYVTATDAGARSGPVVTIGQHEARTLLRACMPVPMLAVGKRGKHAALLSALHNFALQLHDLNDPWAGPRVTAAALDFAQTLRAWIDTQRWAAATAKAGVSWPESLAVTAVLRQSTATDVPVLFEERPEPIARKPRRAATRPAGQGNLLLPLASKNTPDPAAKPAVPVSNKATRRRQADAA